MPEEAASGMEAMSATTAEHERLATLAGTFNAEVSMWMGPGDPMVVTGTIVNETDLGGRYLKQTYTGDPNDGPFPAFEGRGYFGFNTAIQRYEGFWIDNASTVMQIESGDLDESGKVWTMIGEMAHPAAGTLLASGGRRNLPSRRPIRASASTMRPSLPASPRLTPGPLC